MSLKQSSVQHKSKCYQLFPYFEWDIILKLCVSTEIIQESLKFAKILNDRLWSWRNWTIEFRSILSKWSNEKDPIFNARKKKCIIPIDSNKNVFAPFYCSSMRFSILSIVLSWVESYCINTLKGMLKIGFLQCQSYRIHLSNKNNNMKKELKREEKK